MVLQLTGVRPDPALLDLPWAVPLEDWPASAIVSLPRGLSRHTVRFVRLGDDVYAIKELTKRYAQREYRLLRDLARLDVPAVEADAVVTGRVTDQGEELDAALITKHLQFSLPYRALFSRTLRSDTTTRLLDALAVLLVRLHLAGFYWGDCSLSNTLFRRDAGAFAAYLVDAETGELHPALSEGQRAHDIELARTNILGDLLDLEAGGLLHPSIDPIDTADEICQRYNGLWAELTGPEVLDVAEWHRLDSRIRRLNKLGFDVAELQIERNAGERRVVVQPKVVDSGYHQRKLLRLTGLDVEENQARRLLNDLEAFRAHLIDTAGERDEEIAAHRWLLESFQPTVAAVPAELRRKLEPAQLFHEVLDHRWYLSEADGRDVGLAAATKSYVDTVLGAKPDERAVLVDGTAEID
jgi:tRNA A-37 threonylcarbamoyl transferase component Bud32